MQPIREEETFHFFYLLPLSRLFYILSDVCCAEAF